jgi:hypothetical protein
MLAMTMTQKTLLAGLVVLAVGLAAGYGAGVVKEARDTDGWRGGMMRAENGLGNWAGRDDNRGRMGMMDGRGRDGSGSGKGGGQGMMGGGQGMGQGFGQMPGQGRGNVDQGNCLSDECLFVDGLEYPAGVLTDAAKSALASALDDEYKALATYEAVMAKEGRARPFVMIARAEEQHISSLKALFDKYGMTVTENPYTGRVTAPDSMTASCQAGVDAEVANAALYRDTLLPAVKDYADITSVFTNLMNASQERHLPAFDRCN